MFDKLVAIEPTGLISSAQEQLHNFAKEVVFYNDIPSNEEEICKRIGDADAVLLSYTTTYYNSVQTLCTLVCAALYTHQKVRM